MTFIFLLCACSGYAAFGSNTPGSILMGSGFKEPFWLIDLANVFLIVHLVGAYQVSHHTFQFLPSSFTI
jgi:amino acid permease